MGGPRSTGRRGLPFGTQWWWLPAVGQAHQRLVNVWISLYESLNEGLPGERVVLTHLAQVFGERSCDVEGRQGCVCSVLYANHECDAVRVQRVPVQTGVPASAVEKITEQRETSLGAVCPQLMTVRAPRVQLLQRQAISTCQYSVL